MHLPGLLIFLKVIYLCANCMFESGGVGPGNQYEGESACQVMEKEYLLHISCASAVGNGSVYCALHCGCKHLTLLISV